MFEEKRLPSEWKDRLILENTPVTLAEYQAGVLIRQMGQLIEAAQALRHLEGMVGAIDDAFARQDSEYAGSAQVRAALDTHRRAISELADQAPGLSEALRTYVQSREAIEAPRSR